MEERVAVRKLYNFDPNEYFSDHDYYEEYKPNKSYDTDEFFFSYNNYGVRKYRFIKYKIKDTSSNMSLDYVLAEEILSHNEVSHIRQCCQCEYHKISYINPIKLLMCPCCFGCLQSKRPQMSVMRETRKYMDENKLNWYNM